MKKLFCLIAMLMIIALPVQASYRSEVNSAANEVLYYAYIRRDGFNKYTKLEFGKSIKMGQNTEYFIIPAFYGYERLFLSDTATLLFDDVSYELKKDTNAPHIAKRHSPNRRDALLAEYPVSQEIVEKIKSSKGNIKILVTIVGKRDVTMEFGLKTSDEIRFIIERSFEDIEAVGKNKLVPKYSQKQNN